MVPRGRPPNRPLEHDTNVQTKRGRSEYVKRKQNLKPKIKQTTTNMVGDTKTKMYYNYVCVVKGYTVFVVFF